MTTSQLIQQLIEEGGAIVSSNICSLIEIADAKATGRFAVDDEGFGFVRRYREWVDTRQDEFTTDPLHAPEPAAPGDEEAWQEFGDSIKAS